MSINAVEIICVYDLGLKLFWVRKMYISRLRVSFSCDFSMVWVPGTGPSYIFEWSSRVRKMYMSRLLVSFPVISQWFGYLGQMQVTFLYPTYCQLQMYRRWTWKTCFFRVFGLFAFSCTSSTCQFCIQNVHVGVLGSISLWFLSGLGAWGKVKLHFWMNSLSLTTSGKCTCWGVGLHFPVIFHGLGAGAGPSYIFEWSSRVRKMYISRLLVSFSCDFSMVWVPGAGPSYISIPHILSTNV